MKDKHIISIFLSVISIVVGLGILTKLSLVSLPQQVTGYGGYEPTKCTDSDGGIASEDRGGVAVTYPESAGAFTNYYYDKCIDDKTLLEYYCSDTRKNETTLPCKYGCNNQNGTCKEAPKKFFGKYWDKLFKPRLTLNLKPTINIPQKTIQLPTIPSR